MRILINAASAHMGGSVTYLQNLLQELPKALPDASFQVYAPDPTCGKLPSRGGGEVRPYPYPRTRGLARLYFDQVEIPRLVRKEGIDILLSATGFGTLWSPVPQVLTVRNMSYFDPTYEAKYRELNRSFAKKRLRRWHSLLSIWAADTVLFPTQATRDAVAACVSLEDKTTRALHYGYDRVRFAALDHDDSVPPDALRQCVEAEGEILLNVSTYAVHKNLETLIEALPLLLDRDPSLTLVTTTSREQTSDTAEYDALRERAGELGVAGAWVELGYVPHEELPAVYRAADLYVFPSFTESFGQSMVEAMACALPVVAADTAVHREVCGKAAAYFDTFDATDCAETIWAVLDSDERRAELARASMRRADHFTWERYANRLAQLFQELIRTGENGRHVATYDVGQSRPTPPRVPRDADGPTHA